MRRISKERVAGVLSVASVVFATLLFASPHVLAAAYLVWAQIGAQ